MNMHWCREGTHYKSMVRTVNKGYLDVILADRNFPDTTFSCVTNMKMI